MATQKMIPSYPFKCCGLASMPTLLAA